MNCQCPSDCKSTMLSVFESSQQLDFDFYCSSVPTKIYAGHLLQKHKLWFQLQGLVNNIPRNIDDEHEICKYLLKNHVVIVKVELASKAIMRSVRDKRFPFEAQLASLGTRFTCSFIDLNSLHVELFFIKGGTLGLFVGMSVISVVEIVVWIVSTLKALILSFQNR